MGVDRNFHGTSRAFIFQTAMCFEGGPIVLEGVYLDEENELGDGIR